MDHTQIKETLNCIEYVDLGLSVKWANCNLGAKTSEETGHRFTCDEKAEVDYVKLPTKAQWNELIKNCTWKWKSGKNPGCLVTGKNGNSIFLPACGELNTDGLKEVGKAGSYWSSDIMRTANKWGYYFSFMYGIYNLEYKINKGVYSTVLSARTLVIRPVQ